MHEILTCSLIALSAGPLGVCLILRRMTLMADALSHGLIPGMALGYALMGVHSLWASVIGGGSTLLLACGARRLAQHTAMTQESVFAAFSLITMALGLGILSMSEHHCFHHVLSGSLDIGAQHTLLAFCVALVTGSFWYIYGRDFMMNCFDPLFFKAHRATQKGMETIFMAVLILNLLTSLQILGTLMSLGLIILPALIAYNFAANLWIIQWSAALIGIVSSLLGILLSHQRPDLCGVFIVGILGIFYVFSIVYNKKSTF